MDEIKDVGKGEIPGFGQRVLVWDGRLRCWEISYWNREFDSNTDGYFAKFERGRQERLQLAFLWRPLPEDPVLRQACYELKPQPTAKELIEVLSKLSPEALVLIPSGEGNAYRADGIRIIEEVQAVPIVALRESDSKLVPADYRVITRHGEDSIKAVYIH